MTIENILKEFAVSFTKKIDQEYHFTVQLEFTDISDKNIWQLDIKNKDVIIYDKVIARPEEIFLLTVNTLEKLYNNELSSLTAFLQESNEKGVMCSLIDIKKKKKTDFGTVINLNRKSWILLAGRMFLQVGFLTDFTRLK
jgi:hypothetical protein